MSHWILTMERGYNEVLDPDNGEVTLRCWILTMERGYTEVLDPDNGERLQWRLH